MKKLGVGKRKKVSGGSMLPKLLVAASKLQRAPLPRVRVQPQISSSCDDDGGKMGGGGVVVRNLYLGTLPSLKEVGEAAREKLEKLGKHHL